MVRLPSETVRVPPSGRPHGRAPRKPDDATGTAHPGRRPGVRLGGTLSVRRAGPSAAADRPGGTEGVLYAHELPPPANGALKRPLLPALLNGQLHDLIPLRPTAVDGRGRRAGRRPARRRRPRPANARPVPHSGSSRVGKVPNGGGDRGPGGRPRRARPAAGADGRRRGLRPGTPGRPGRRLRGSLPGPRRKGGGVAAGLRRLVVRGAAALVPANKPCRPRNRRPRRRNAAWPLRGNDEAVWAELEDLARRLRSVGRRETRADRTDVRLGTRGRGRGVGCRRGLAASSGAGGWPVPAATRR